MEEMLRKATIEDCHQIFTWANDPLVRAYSFHSKQIVYEEHIKWFKESLANPDCDMYIFVHDGKEVGQVRINWKDNVGIINYSVAEAYRNRGYGQRMLYHLEKLYPSGRVLVGNVKTDNVVSQRCFEKMGYEKSVQENAISYRKTITIPDSIGGGYEEK